MEWIAYILRAIVIFFTVLSTLLAVYTMQHRMRLRQVKMSWYNAKIKGIPIFSSVFFLSVCLCLLLPDYFSKGIENWMDYAYALTGITWFVASRELAKVYVTSHGIVKNVTNPDQSIAWHSIYDFAEKKEKNGVTFVFLYRTKEAGSPIHNHRIKLRVPRNKYEKFGDILRHNIGKRLGLQEVKTEDIPDNKKF